MQDYVSLAIVGAVVSVLVQFLKNSVSTSRLHTIGIVIVLSMVAGGVYWVVRDTSYWTDFLQVLVFANAIYGFIIKQLE